MDQVLPSGALTPLTPYHFWPAADAWEDLRAELESADHAWVPPRERVRLLNRAAAVIDVWQSAPISTGATGGAGDPAGGGGGPGGGQDAVSASPSGPGGGVGPGSLEAAEALFPDCTFAGTPYSPLGPAPPEGGWPEAGRGPGGAEPGRGSGGDVAGGRGARGGRGRGGGGGRGGRARGG